MFSQAVWTDLLGYMIDGSTLGFNVIHGLPTDSEGRLSTTMTELDWQAAIAVFRALLPQWGAKGRNDRLFLEALHHHLASAAEALRQME